MSETSQATGAKLTFKNPNASASTLEFVRPSNLNAGDAVQGEYLGAMPSRFDETKQDYKLEEIDDAGNKTGRTLIVNSGGNLGARMSDISVGSLIRIEYKGKQKIKKGKMAGKESHNFEVLVAE